MSWIEGESLLVIGDGRFFHFGSLTFLTHDDIFRGKALEEFLLFLFPVSANPKSETSYREEWT